MLIMIFKKYDNTTIINSRTVDLISNYKTIDYPDIQI